MPTYCALLSLDHKLIRISDSTQTNSIRPKGYYKIVVVVTSIKSNNSSCVINFSSQALAGLERMQELVGKNLNNIVGNLWQRQETETGSGSSHGNIVSTFYIFYFFR